MKDSQINVRCSKEQKLLLQEKAKKIGLSLSSFLLHSAIIYTNTKQSIPIVYTKDIQIEKKEEIVSIKPPKKRQNIPKRVADIKNSRKNMFENNSVKNILKKVE